MDNGDIIKIKTRKALGEDVYILFKCWCTFFKNQQGYNNAEYFAQFLKEQNRTLNFWQKKHLLEEYFGYVFNWDMKNEKWDIRRRNNG